MRELVPGGSVVLNVGNDVFLEHGPGLLTTRGAVVGGSMGLVTAVVLTILSPTVWAQVLGHASAVYTYEYPALFSMLVAFTGIYLVSVTDRSARGAWERSAYLNQRVDCELGLSNKHGS